MTIESGANINFNSYEIKKPDNLSQKALKDAQAKTLTDEIAKSEVKKTKLFSLKNQFQIKRKRR